LGRNDLAFLTVVWQKITLHLALTTKNLLASQNGRHDIATAPCSGTSILLERPFCVCHVLHFCQLLSKTSIDLELEYGISTKSQ